MDPRERADATLARARARGAFVVTPESAISPMDAASTQQIPRALVAAMDGMPNDPEATMVVPAIPAHGRHELIDDRPAIAQEASTQVMGGPPPRRSPEAREQQPLSWAPAVQPDPPEPEHVEGLIPTVKPPRASRSSLSQRLDG